MFRIYRSAATGFTDNTTSTPHREHPPHAPIPIQYIAPQYHITTVAVIISTITAKVPLITCLIRRT
jgi:hypothetical protein